jgi:putative flippase GtrA
MGVSNTLNALIVMVLVTVFNYVVSKFWIFQTQARLRDRRRKDTEQE